MLRVLLTLAVLATSSVFARVLPASNPRNIQSSDPNSLIQTYQTKYQKTLVRLASRALPADQIPIQTALNATSGEFEWQTASFSWVRGFFPGVLWQLYSTTKDESWKTAALQYTNPLRQEANDNTTHDVGFMVFSSFGLGVELGGMGSDYVDVLVNTAHTLALRYSDIVNMTRSWGDITDESSFMVIVDNLMNLELLFWAGKQTGNATLTQMAINHVQRTPQYWIRPDGSTTHLCVFNPVNGDLMMPCTATPQGLSANSTWARGQAWSIYGFTMAYRYTHIPEFLDAARAVTAFYLTNTPSLIPLWDYDAKDNILDTSAAVITASALFELAEHTNEPSFAAVANQIISSVESRFVSSYVHTTEGVVAGNQKDCGNVACTCGYTDYYFLEALRRSEAAASAAKDN